MYLVVDKKFVFMMFVSLFANYVKLSETGKCRMGLILSKNLKISNSQSSDRNIKQKFNICLTFSY